MKYLVASFIIFAYTALPTFVYGLTLPAKPQGYVSDFAALFTPEEKTVLEQKLAAHEQQTSVEIAVVTTPDLAGTTIEAYAVELFESWGIGKKGQDNGLLLLVAPSDREVRIEVGYGLEPVVTDAESSWIIRDQLLPEFKKNQYGNGINLAVDRLIALTAGTVAPRKDSPSFNSNVLIVAFVLIQMIYGMLAATKSWWLGGVIGAIAGVVLGIIYGFMITGLLALVVFIPLGLVIDYFASKWGISHGVKQTGPWWHSGGSWGGGRSGGGFGGFGGGRSGGGGSSGSW